MKAVIFDCDGVLVDSEAIATGVFGDILRERGIEIEDKYIFSQLKGGSIHESLAFIKNYLPNVNLEIIEKEYRLKSFEAFAKFLHPVSGIKSLLMKLNLPRSIASNGPKNKIMLNLKTTGLIHFFDEPLIFSAHDIQSFKPNPKLFLHAAHAMGFAPNNCVVIEDSVQGAQAAQAAGIPCYGYTADTDPGDFTKFAATPFNHMSELEQILDLI